MGGIQIDDPTTLGSGIDNARLQTKALLEIAKVAQLAVNCAIQIGVENEDRTKALVALSDGQDKTNAYLERTSDALDSIAGGQIDVNEKLENVINEMRSAAFAQTTDLGRIADALETLTTVIKEIYPKGPV